MQEIPKWYIYILYGVTLNVNYITRQKQVGKVHSIGMAYEFTEFVAITATTTPEEEEKNQTREIHYLQALF